MTAYLITWKPASENPDRGWPEREVIKLAKSVRTNGSASRFYSFRRAQGVEIGQRVYLLRQGRKGPAIMGYGKVDSLPDKEDPGLIKILFEALVDPRSGTAFASKEELRFINAKRYGIWDSQFSGVRLDHDVEVRLRKLVIGRKPIDVTDNPTVGNLEKSSDELGAVNSIVSPLSRSGRRGQGYGVTAEQRRAVELRAMVVAEKYLIRLGYSVRDLSATESYDYAASLEGTTLFVEVKGTSGAAKEILLTKSEVELQRKVYPKNLLIVVEKIKLSRRKGRLVASAGSLKALRPWRIAQKALTPAAYRYRLPKGK